jgi:hypothetical protein
MGIGLVALRLPLSVAAALVTVVACSAAPRAGSTTSSPVAAASGTSGAVPAFVKPFASTVGGYSLKVPADMDPKPATEAMPAGLDTWADDPFVDQFFGVGVGPLEIVSAPVAPATSQAWISDRETAIVLTGTAFPDVCQAKSVTSAIEVDGHMGMLDTTCGATLLVVIVADADRVYELDLHGSPPSRDWLAALLATVHLDPQSAIAAPAPSSAPSPSS